MNKLSKDKRNQLIIAVLVTLAVLAVVGFGLIRAQYASIARLAVERVDARNQLKNIDNAIQNADVIQSKMIDTSYTLARAEDGMASGDVYAWNVDMIRRFKAQYSDIDIPQIGQPEISDVDLLPQFPYKQVRVTVSGTAYYHDLGRFIADFENTYPYARLVNLTLEPASTDLGAGSEKLSFRMDIISLVKPNSSSVQ